MKWVEKEGTVRKHLRRVLSFVVVSIPIILAASSLPVSATAQKVDPATQGEHEETREETLAIDAAELARTLSIPLDLEMQFVDRQVHVGHLNAALLETAPDVFGGLYVDYLPDYTIVVLAKPGEGAPLERLATAAASESIQEFVQVRETELTTQVLLEARNLIVEAAAKHIDDDRSDIVMGTITIGTPSEEDADAVRAIIADLDLPIPPESVNIEVGRSSDDLDSIGGLTVIHPDTGNPGCTTGFSVSQIGGGPDGMANAAHCANEARVNGIDLEHVDGLWGGSQDVQWFKTPNMADDNRVKDASDDHSRRITGRITYAEIFRTMHLCMYGRVHEYQCGTVIDVTYRPGCTSGHCFEETFVLAQDMTAGGGDSGGPYFIGQDAIGVHKGSRFNGDPYFMAQDFMNDLGIRPKVAP